MMDNILFLIPPDDFKWPMAVQAVLRSLQSTITRRSQWQSERFGQHPENWTWFHLRLLIRIPGIDFTAEEFRLYEYVTVSELHEE
jgi:hypothetical protein